MSRFSEIPQPDGSLEVRLGDSALTCLVCRNMRFHERTSLLNSRGGELFGLAWADKRATNYICTNCGYVFWFAE
jgi:hypothetical protein